MSEPADTASTSVSPDARRMWQAARGPVAIGLLVVLTGIVVALVRGGGSGGAVDPRSVDRGGSRAVANLLGAQGVRVELVESYEAATGAAPGATLLVTRPDRLRPDRLADLAGRAEHAVLIAPGQPAVDALDLPAVAGDEVEVGDRRPDCDLDSATAAGVARMGGTRYEPTGGRARSCYGATLLADGRITLLGTPVPLTNDALDEQGDAALALRILGRHERLVWYVPSLADTAAQAEQRPLADLLPAGWRWGVVQVAVAALLFALWRARRLGPVVVEPLPVVVRAAETAEGRARLYRRSGAADHAATALRQATIHRMTTRLGLPRTADPEAVAEAVAAASDGRDVRDLLYGPPPTDDAGLVRLAGELDALEREVGRR